MPPPPADDEDGKDGTTGSKSKSDEEEEEDEGIPHFSFITGKNMSMPPSAAAAAAAVAAGGASPVENLSLVEAKQSLALRRGPGGGALIAYDASEFLAQREFTGTRGV